jgi:hypothetical protein
MPFILKMRSFLRNLIFRSHVDTDHDSVVEAHFGLLTEEYIRKGLTPDEAERAARIELGGSGTDQRASPRTAPWELAFLGIRRLPLCQLRQSPGFAAVVILTLALGIGANTAIFSAVEAVVLAPLPFRQPERLVFLMERNPANKLMMDSSYPDFLDWHRNARSFEQMTAMTWQDYNLTSPGTPEHVNGKEISAGFFGTLGVKLSLGREFTTAEDRRGGVPGVIISHRLWTDRLNGSPQVIGSSVVVSGAEYTIVGVLPSGFQFIDDADVYTPIAQGDPLIMNDRTIHPVVCVARLKPEVTLAQAQSEMSTLQDGLNRLYPLADEGLGSIVSPLHNAADVVGSCRDCVTDRQR